MVGIENKKYPSNLFVLGLLFSMIVYYYWLFILSLVLMLLALLYRPCLYLGWAILLVDFIFSLIQQLKIRNVLLKDSDDPDMQNFKGAVLGEGSWRENVIKVVDKKINKGTTEEASDVGITSIQVLSDQMTPELFLDLYTSVGWEPPCIEQVAIAIENSCAKFVAFDGEKPVGMMRLLGDGGMSFYIKDFVVIPEFQNKGIGKILLSSAEAYIKKHIEKDWAVSLELISTKEAVIFYEKNGFEIRPCEWDGPGMFKMIR